MLLCFFCIDTQSTAKHILGINLPKFCIAKAFYSAVFKPALIFGLWIYVSTYTHMHAYVSVVCKILFLWLAISNQQSLLNKDSTQLFTCMYSQASCDPHRKCSRKFMNMSPSFLSDTAYWCNELMECQFHLWLAYGVFFCLCVSMWNIRWLKKFG